MNEHNRDYLRFTLILVSPLAVLAAFYWFPDTLRAVTLGVIALLWFFVAVAITPLFESWKSLSLWEKWPNYVHEYVYEEVDRKEAEAMISDNTYLKRMRNKIVGPMYSKYDVIRWSLRFRAKQHNEKAEALERLCTRLEDAAQ
jgi:hypothetical protein